MIYNSIGFQIFDIESEQQKKRSPLRPRSDSNLLPTDPLPSSIFTVPRDHLCGSSELQLFEERLRFQSALCSFATRSTFRMSNAAIRTARTPARILQNACFPAQQIPLSAAAQFAPSPQLKLLRFMRLAPSSPTAQPGDPTAPPTCKTTPTPLSTKAQRQRSKVEAQWARKNPKGPGGGRKEWRQSACGYNGRRLVPLYATGKRRPSYRTHAVQYECTHMRCYARRAGPYERYLKMTSEESHFL